MLLSTAETWYYILNCMCNAGMFKYWRIGLEIITLIYIHVLNMCMRTVCSGDCQDA